MRLSLPQMVGYTSSRNVSALSEARLQESEPSLKPWIMRMRGMGFFIPWERNSPTYYVEQSPFVRIG
jgi:hypothetical protein